MRRYYDRDIEGLGRIVLESRGLRPRISRFAYCANDGRVFVSDDLDLLDRISQAAGDDAAVYILETREQLDAGVVLTRGPSPMPAAAPKGSTRGSGRGVPVRST